MAAHHFTRRLVRRRGATAVVAALFAAAAVMSPAGVAHAAPVGLEFDTWPASPWTHFEGPGSSATLANGKLTTSGNNSYGLVYPNGEWFTMVDNAKGWVIESRLRVAASSDDTCSDDALWVNDMTYVLHLSFSTDEVCLTYPTEATARFDTTDAFHVYRIELKGPRFKLLIDGITHIDIALGWTGGGTQMLTFGTGVGSSSSPNTIAWDYFRYDVSPGLPACTVVGTALDDVLEGTDGDDNICAGRGNDVVHANGGNDSVAGFQGNDRIYGGAGNDRLHGADGNDRLLGGSGNDTLSGLKGTDTCDGGVGTDAQVGCETRTSIP